MNLHELADRPGARKKRSRIGRGIGSGTGKTGGRGGKGQTARSGVRIKGFEGGQMPLHRRLPKRGFTPLTRDDIAEVRTSELEAMKATEIDLAALKAEKIVSHKALGAKIILSGKLERKITLKVKASKGARAMIEAAGGKVEFTEKPAPERKDRSAKKEKKKAAAEKAANAAVSAEESPKA
jgi:large subunit ribosomal protein L15